MSKLTLLGDSKGGLSPLQDRISWNHEPHPFRVSVVIRNEYAILLQIVTNEKNRNGLIIELGQNQGEKLFENILMSSCSLEDYRFIFDLVNQYPIIGNMAIKISFPVT